MKHTWSTAVAALLSLDPLVSAAQRFTASSQGCPLDLSAQVAAEVNCGKKSTVAFAVEWYGTETVQLERWFRLAGCGISEAATEAVRVADRCQTQFLPTGNVDDTVKVLQPERHDAQRLVGKRTLDLEARGHDKRAPADADSSSTSTTSSDTSTTLATSTTSTSASSTSSNPYVVTHTSGTSTSLMTCMTMTTKTTSYCSTYTTNRHHTSSCSTGPVSFPTCLDGLSCAFSQTTGTLSCYELGDVPVYGKIILAIMAIAALLAISSILTLCCRDRNKSKKNRQAAEEKALLASMAPKTADVTVEEVEAEAPQQQQTAHNDTAPLMRADEPAHGNTPQIVVSGGHTPVDGSASFPPGRYDPFADEDHHYGH